MFQELLKNKAFKSRIQSFFREHEQELFDIVLFGSSVKGKTTPKDIDLLLLFKNKENLELAYQLRKMLEKYQKHVSITTKTYKSLKSETFVAKEAFLSEGYSLVYDQFNAHAFGFTNVTLFKYELKGFSQSQRMRFQYSLQGRNKQKGMLQELNLIKFSDSILLSPITTTERTRDYLLYWKIKFQEISILLPKRIMPT